MTLARITTAADDTVRPPGGQLSDVDDAAAGRHSRGGVTDEADRVDFLSGESGRVMGIRTVARALLRDAAHDLARLVTLEPLRLARAAAVAPPTRRVLALGATVRPERQPFVDAAIAELRRSRHDVEVAFVRGEGRGKFANLNAALAERSLAGVDWLLVVDDDVSLPRGFLDRFLFLVERFDLRLAQPAHRARSHAAWRVTRRQGGSVLRETQFVEIGPVTAFHRDTFDVLLPFPDVAMGWGLDVHWAAVARERGWRCGVADAVAVRHLVPIADDYPWEQAADEGRRFTAGRPFVPTGEAKRTLVRHRSWLDGVAVSPGLPRS